MPGFRKLSNEMFTYDDSISKKTIRDIPNKSEYLKLMNVFYDTTKEWRKNQNIPQDMYSKMENLIQRKLLLDDSHFQVSMTQFQQFLFLIQDELNHKFDKKEFSQFGQIKFNANTRIDAHSVDEEDWDSKDGLFYSFAGVEPKSINDSYESDCASFRTFLYNEFFKDHSKIKDFEDPTGELIG